MGARGFIPRFSGEAKDMDAFVDMILSDMTDEQLAYYVYTKYADTEVNTQSGYILPPSAVGGTDAIGGVLTDFPMPIHVGESWDVELAERIGKAKGEEERGQKNIGNPNTLLFMGGTDLRMNPLNGRLYEGFSEDLILTAQITDAEAKGAKGQDDFYLMAQILTKHFSSYVAEWNRSSETNYITARALREYYFDVVLRAFENNNIQGVMTAFGAINGVPWTFSPYLRVLQERSNKKYSLFSVSDFIGDYDTMLGLGNGYDVTYTKTPEQIAGMLTKAKSYSNNNDNNSVTVNDTLSALSKGLFGITRIDLEEQVRPQIELWVRTGYFNQSEYPYADICADGNNPVKAENNMEVALDAAYGGITLLKNTGNILPLNDSNNILVTGVMSDILIKPWYSVSSPEGIDNVSLTPVAAVRNYFANKPGTVDYNSLLSGTCFKVRSALTGNYLKVDEANNYVYANETDVNCATVFQLYDWGQQGYSFIEPSTNKFLYHDDTLSEFYMEEMSSQQAPSIFSWETDGNGNNFSRWGAVPSEPLGTVSSSYQFYQFYNNTGNYISIDGTGKVIIGVTKGEVISSESYFDIEVISRPGENIEDYVARNDYAVIFIGTDPYVNSSEMTDRKNIEIGQEQLELVNRVSTAFPQKTIVVLETNFPLAIQEIQDNPNVSAILYTSYGGQFESYALIRVLFGEVNPSGRLTHSWYKNLSMLPKLEKKEGIDDAYTKYMQNADPGLLNLTYLYNDSNDLVYEFGYGLSYTSFAYSTFEIIGQGNAGDALTVTLTITNTGSYSGRDVIQVYARSCNSAYGEYVPNKQLVAFLKTEEIPATTSQQVTISINPDNLRKWDVSTQKYIVEAGIYDIIVGTSSENTIWSTQTTIQGDSISKVDLTEKKNVWDYTFACHNATGIEVSKRRTSEFEGEYFAVLADSDDAHIVLPKVLFGTATQLEISAAGTEDENNIEIYGGNMDGKPICSYTFGATEPITYYLDEDNTILVEELGYVTLSQKIGTIAEGENLYILFRNKNTRIDYIVAR